MIKEEARDVYTDGMRRDIKDALHRYSTMEIYDVADDVQQVRTERTWTSSKKKIFLLSKGRKPFVFGSSRSSS